MAGAMTARARQPPTKACVHSEWPARRLPSRFSAIAIACANAVRRCSWEWANGLYWFSIVLRRHFALRIGERAPSTANQGVAARFLTPQPRQRDRQTDFRAAIEDTIDR